MNIRMKLALSTSMLALAFDSGSGWKMDGDKIATDASGNPIYINASGIEQTVEGGTISRLNGEAKGHRERAEKAEASLKVFEGLDPEAARKAIETVGKLDAKQLIDAGEVDKVRAEVGSQYQGQLTAAQQALQDANGKIDGLTLDRAFSRSEFIANRIAVPREMFEATFGRNFKIEDGKPVPYGPDGNKIYSKKKMGEIADVDEAFEILVENYAHKDTILRANGNSGSGNNGNGGNRGGSRQIKRSEFEAMSPMEQSKAAQAAGKSEITIVD